MKRKLIVLLLVVLLFSVSNAQEKADSLKIFKTNSLQFGVRTLSLTNFTGALVSYKYHVDDQTAYRFGISARIEKSNEDEIRDYFYHDTSYLDLKRDNIFTSIQLNVQYLHYVNVKDEIKVFLGFGPQVEIYMYDFDTDKINASGNANIYDKKRINDRYSFGFRGSFGVEWFFIKNLSLHAEYGLFAYYFLEKNNRITVFEYSNEPNRYNEIKVESNGWGLDDAGALFGLSVYF